jgi:5-formyltetrahydrofolate cyclo-ligase
MPDTELKARKKALRDYARNVRCTLTPRQIEQKSACICGLLQNYLDGVDPVMVYVSKPLEVNTRSLIESLIRRRGRVIVPVIEKETVSLRLSWLDDTSVLKESTFHVYEPVENEIPARPEEVRAAIIPVLGFDLQGNRLGYGAGYYDRFLSRYPKINRIGLAFACQEIPEIPCEENDMKMHVVVTEKGICQCSENSRHGTYKSPATGHNTLK